MGAFLWGMFTRGLDLPDYFVITNCAVVILYVLGGGWLEWQRLLEGGASVAHRLGAETPNPYHTRDQRLLNIGEELAIAAGIPVPEMFVLDHPSINALTAGHDPAHCAVVVTRGALEQLTRNELQSVVAHEYAHIVNGDVALNTRLTGALYGLYSLNLLGRAMLSAAFTTDRKDRPLLPWPLLILGGVVLTTVGWIGAFSGRLMQSGVSRQREFLADAQAVQFTRDRDGLGRALRKIAGQDAVPVRSEYSEVVAHLWLGSDGSRNKWFDTHPPLMTRIRRLYGRPLPAIRPAVVEVEAASPSKAAPVIETLDWPGNAGAADPGAGVAGLVPLAGAAAIATAGAAIGTTAGAITAAAAFARHDPSLQAQVDAVVEQASAHAHEADELIHAVRQLGSDLEQSALLLNAIVAGPVNEDEQEPVAVGPGVGSLELKMALQWLRQPQAQWLRVPLVELLTSRVRHWPLEHRMTLVKSCNDAVLADGRIEKTEWIYFTLVRHRLLPDERTPREWTSATQRRRALAEVFSMAGQLSRQSARRVRDAVVMAAEQIGVEQPTATPDQFQFRSLTLALDVLRTLPPLRKPLLLKVLQTLSPDKECASYHAFLVAVAAAIDCPPLEPFTPISGRMQSIAGRVATVAGASECADLNG